MSAPHPTAALAQLQWLVAMGADEVVLESPVDRFAVAPPPAAVVEASALAAKMAVASVTGGDAAAIAAQCRSLDDIAEALRRFDACPLKKTATNLCFADGLQGALTLLVGEAPGRDEDLQGKPFVGRSGQLLDRMLAEIALSRTSADPASAVYITNTIYWRPPGNRTPTEAETLQCLPFLLRTIALMRPKRIVCLGNTPTQRLLARADGILKTRGKWYTYEVDGVKTPLLPTLHPAYLLRQPQQKRLAWRDLLMLREAIDAG